MYSPWGTVQHAEPYEDGIVMVSTASHGGIMIPEAIATQRLSPAAQKRALRFEGFYCYEEDCDWAIPTLELLALRSGRYNGRVYHVSTEEELMRTLSGWHADYLLERGLTPEPTAYTQWQLMQEEDARRKARDPDLIVSAIGGPVSYYPDLTADQVMVTTADGQRHVVTRDSYRSRSERGGLNLLSHCILITSPVHTV